MLVLILCCLMALTGEAMGYNETDILPDGRTVAQFLKTSGYEEQMYETMKEKEKELQQMLKTHYAKEEPDDIIYNLDQINLVMESLTSSNSSRRRKRAALWPPWRWNKSKFKYIFSNEFDEDQREVIELAIEVIEDETCIEFEETDVFQESDLFFNHMAFMGSDSCRSFIGNNPGIPFAQSIFLPTPLCFSVHGIIVHEIGHFLDLVHEQNREERCVSGSFIQNGLDSLDMPYDYQSIMHYSINAGLIPRDRRFDSTLGQESELSFLDKRFLNQEYCKFCDNSDNCLNNGFRAIGKCKDDCVCPDGLDGDWCEEVEDDSDGDCEPGDEVVYAEIDSGDGKEQCLTSPDYNKKGYKPSDVCTWMIMNGKIADDRCQIKLWFEDDFSIRRESRKNAPTCDNWVEVRLDNPRKPGQRFCGSGPQKFKSADGTETKNVLTNGPVLVNFRTFIRTDEANEDKKDKGFKLCYVRECSRDFDPTC